MVTSSRLPVIVASLLLKSRNIESIMFSNYDFLHVLSIFDTHLHYLIKWHLHLTSIKSVSLPIAQNGLTQTFSSVLKRNDVVWS